MARPAITAVGLSKRYRTTGTADGWLDALKDVSFEIAVGEAVGLIGRNGAGKSTLLRVLSRVTRPTAGHADVYGTVGAMLEVGTGFHPELSGRENTYLSGAILGLSKREVQARFDEIVAFAEIEPFIDMPVKRYSSGMYARLGFAVAAHLRPSILIVDEVLAVGDLPFQAKCLAHMHRLTDDGTAVLFVSHNLLAVADLCQRGLVLIAGQLAFDGLVDDAVAAYQRSLSQRGASADAAQVPSWISLTINGAINPTRVDIKSNASLDVEASVFRPELSTKRPVVLNLLIEAHDGHAVVHLRSDLAGSNLELQPGRTTVRVAIPQVPLATGNYSLWLRFAGLDGPEPLLWDSQHITLDVVGGLPSEALVQPKHEFEQLAGNPAETAPPEQTPMRHVEGATERRAPGAPTGVLDS